MEALTPAETSKLFGLLGMLASPFDGERATAGLLATKLIESKGLEWSDLIRPALAYYPPPPPPRPAPSSAMFSWQTQVARCMATQSLLTLWENEFLHSIARRHSLSPKQEETLATIVDRLARRCGR